MTTPTPRSVAGAADFGTPRARKTGRDPRFPYVPVIVLPTGQQSQVLGLAFTTRDDALHAAKMHIAAQRDSLAAKLGDPRFRALREQHGMPRDL